MLQLIIYRYIDRSVLGEGGSVLGTCIQLPTPQFIPINIMISQI